VDAPQPGIQRVVFALEAMMRSDGGAGKLYASMAQYWTEQNGKPVIVATQRTNLAQLPQPIAPKPDLYPDSSEARTDIGVALAAAARNHRRVILDFGGNWCYDCHVLDAAFHLPAIAGILERSYIVVNINIGQYDKNLDLAQKYQIPLKKGVPSLAILDSSGVLLVSQKQGDFENTSKIGPKDIEEFLERWRP
ncbi:MAG: thioredoxin family protein, partial [Candidatus Acidiferrales bacterium]